MTKKRFNTLLLLPLFTIFPVGLIVGVSVFFNDQDPDPPKQDATYVSIVIDTTSNDTTPSDSILIDTTFLNNREYVEGLPDRKKEEYYEWKKTENIDLRQQQINENLSEMDRLKITNDSILKEMKKQ